MKEQIKVFRDMLAKVSAMPVLKNEAERLERAIRDLERIPEEPILVALPDGLTLKTQEASHFEDLPFDAYVLGRNGELLEWADGMTEIEALKKVLVKATNEGRAGGSLPRTPEAKVMT